MSNRVLWFLLSVLAVGLLVVMLRHDAGTVGSLDTSDFAALVVKVSLLIFVGGAVLALFRQRLAEAIQAALFWIVVALALVTGYTYRHDLREVGDRVLSELLPGRAVSRGASVEFARSRAGEFQVMAEINGARIALVLDTGASSVVLTQDAAKAAGLPLDMLSYNVNIDTANGRARAASVTLDRVSVGSITERAVPALIAPAGQLKTSLLGMSFLSRLERWEVRGDRLVLRGYP